MISLMSTNDWGEETYRYQLESPNHSVALALLRPGFRSECSGLSGWRARGRDILEGAR